MTNRFSYRFLLLKLIFPLIYAGFFVVQLFINFDTTLTRLSDRYQVIQHQNQFNYTVAFEKAKNNKPVKTKFRLNKSFQPAFFASLGDIHFAAPVRRISRQRASCLNPFIANPLLNTRLLRGPPFVV
jgi:hypothetical protein